MPLYEYICGECQKTFDKTLTVTEYEKKRKGVKCPHCGSKKTRRHWAAFYVVTSKKS